MAAAVEVSAAEKVTSQDETGRLCDVLRLVIGKPSRVIFSNLSVIVARLRLKRVLLKALCGFEDDLKPVIIIMLLEEN